MMQPQKALSPGRYAPQTSRVLQQCVDNVKAIRWDLNLFQNNGKVVAKKMEDTPTSPSRPIATNSPPVVMTPAFNDFLNSQTKIPLSG